MDDYPGAVAAYSLRLLNTDFTGDAITVRRDSDNSVQDIGFVNGILDTTTLSTFCAGANGYVTKWYDQSGNGNDSVQTTASRQPKIYDVTNGIFEVNGKPSVDFNATASHLLFDSAVSCETVFSVAKIDSIVTINYLLFNYTLPAQGLTYGGTVSLVDGLAYFDGGIYSITGEDTNQHLGYFDNVSNDLNIAKDGEVLTNFTASQTFQFEGISRNQGGLEFKGQIQEIVLYSSTQSSNRTGIETNINDFYSIY